MYLLSLRIELRPLCSRYGNFEDIVKRIDEYEGGIENFALGYQSFGCHVEPDNTFVIKEWAPNAQAR
jgi:1,4-alpha-glucan branching enzyme